MYGWISGAMSKTANSDVDRTVDRALGRVDGAAVARVLDRTFCD